MNDSTHRNEIEARLAQLETLRLKRIQAQKTQWFILGTASALVLVSIIASIALLDFSDHGLSPRSLLFWLVGLMILAVIPVTYWALRAPKGEDDRSAVDALSVHELDEVITHIKRDLSQNGKVAPAHALSLSDVNDHDGALSRADDWEALKSDPNLNAPKTEKSRHEH